MKLTIDFDENVPEQLEIVQKFIDFAKNGLNPVVSEELSGEKVEEILREYFKGDSNYVRLHNRIHNYVKYADKHEKVTDLFNYANYMKQRNAGKKSWTLMKKLIEKLKELELYKL